MRAFLFGLVLSTTAVDTTPQDAERFTHIAGINLADYPSFEALAVKFGPAPIHSSGDASTAESDVCYQTHDGKSVIEFSQGEVDTQFTLRMATPADTACPRQTAIDSAELNVAGLKLGIDKATYKKIVGRPDKETAKRIYRTFNYVHHDIEKNEWDVCIGLDAYFSKGHLTSLTVWRTDTN